MTDDILEISDLSVRFPVKSGFLGIGRKDVHAVERLSLNVRRGETLAIVGESGCGKSTLARALMGLNKPAAGSIRFSPSKISEDTGTFELVGASSSDWKAVRRNVQIVFQDPFSSLSPKERVGDIITEPLQIYGMGSRTERETRAMELLELVGLSRHDYNRYPHEFSGGQRQRIMIARAIALDPEVLIADEAVSALDVSIRLQVINLLNELKERLGLTLIFISHDLGVVRVISDRVAIMYLGRLVEVGANQDVFKASRHPYTRMLLRSTPIPDPDRRNESADVFGELPSPIDPPPGCVFHPRCSFADDICPRTEPVLEKYSPDHLVSCHHADRVG